MTHKRTLFSIVLVFLLAVILVVPLHGQDETVITLLAPEWMADVFNRSLFEQFEAQHPGVKVVLARSEQVFYPPAAYELEAHLDGAEELANTADVLYVQSYNLSPESTRAGYFLDLTPLVEGDPALDVDDFFPALWRSFQWDRGIWALPVTGSLQLMLYNRDAFDEAGLSYPSESWTIDDLARAARTLADYGPDGELISPGFGMFSRGLVFRALVGQGFYDNTVVPNVPSLDHPELARIMEIWAEVQSELQAPGPGMAIRTDEIPLTIERPFRLMSGISSNIEGDWGVALLPGGVAGLQVTGFAVSSGTQHPEIAYELAKFLTHSATVVDRFFGDVPARRSLVGAESGSFMMPREYPAEVQAVIDRAIENALPSSELRFVEYIERALNLVEIGEADPRTALQEMEAEALAALQTAESRRQTAVVMVATPVPTPFFESGQIVLRFGMNLFSSQIPNREEWNRLVREFSGASPVVGNIDLQTAMSGPMGQQDDLDCAYYPQNLIQAISLEDLLNLDPFMDADPNFDRSDFLGGALEQVRRENRTWGYPIVLHPSVMWYNSQQFQQAGVPLPEGGWTIDAFTDALRNLRFVMEDDEQPVLVSQSGGTADHLFMLMAAYGGLPVDYRTSPPTVNLSDAATVDAMRQVLDLARDGYIQYNEMAGMGGGSVMVSRMGQTPLYTDVLMPFSFRIQQRGQDMGEDPYRLTTYPRGSEYVPVSYTVGTAYISATAQNPQACYEWIRFIAERPDLFMGLPARRSQIDNPNIAMTQGEDIAQTYRAYVDLLDMPNTIVFPGMFGDISYIGAYIEQLWLYEAFDDYVLNAGDLDSALTDAAFYIENYRDCIGDITTLDSVDITDMEAMEAFVRQYTDCAVTVDPRMQERFGF
jgi:ABC-type glycerol-3-phosphate transport system substrate-binding protein